MDDQYNPLLPQTGLAVVWVGLLVVTALGATLALLREGRRGGPVGTWLLAFLIGGPISLLFYAATQVRQPGGKRDIPPA